MQESVVKAHDLTFRLFIKEQEISKRVKEMGAEITADYKDQFPLFIGILNGSWMFAADLLRSCNMECEIAFIQLASYAGTETTGQVRTVTELSQPVKGRHIILLEDIVDSGNTLNFLIPSLLSEQPASLSVATLLLKPDMLRHPIEVKYSGFSIEPVFVIGYGLDYNGLGRNLPSLYRLIE